MSFNLDPNRQAQDVIFFRKLQKISHPSIYFSNNPANQVSSQKHLVMILDTKINFQEHLKDILSKSTKLLDYYGSWKTIYLQDHYLQYLNRLSALILITVMLCMTRAIIKLSIRIWSQYNTKQHWL